MFEKTNFSYTINRSIKGGTTMGLFGKIAQGLIDTALIPVDVAKDVVTLGGVTTDQDDPYISEKVKKLRKKLEDIYNSLDED